jgi:2-dehydropantoate 2-reductase
MLNKKSKIGIIGAGAIGGITGAFLSKAGWDVEIVCKYREIADITESSGLHVFGVKGDHHVRMKAVKDIGDMSGPKDIILHATKATDLPESARQMIPFLKEDTVVISLQNGICEEALAEIVGRDRVIGCVVGWGATMHGPGRLEMTSTGEFVIGNIDNRPDERLEFIRNMLNVVLPVKISKNIMGYLYSKLIINSCITSLGAICGLHLGEMLKVKKIRNIFIAIMEEAIRVADAMNIRVEPYRGILNYYFILNKNGFVANQVRHGIIRLIGMKFRRLKSSSLQSLERGRRTEIDYLNGYISFNGKKFNIETPVNDAVISMIKEIEDGRRKITLGNFDNTVFNKF